MARLMKQRQWVTYPVSEERVLMDKLIRHYDLSQNMLVRRLVREEAARHGITASADEIAVEEAIRLAVVSSRSVEDRAQTGTGTGHALRQAGQAY